MHKTATKQKIVTNKQFKKSDEPAMLPSKQAVLNILNYSKVLSVTDSKYLQKFEVILN